jgi:hypothetical protein
MNRPARDGGQAHAVGREDGRAGRVARALGIGRPERILKMFNQAAGAHPNQENTGDEILNKPCHPSRRQRRRDGSPARGELHLSKALESEVSARRRHARTPHTNMAHTHPGARAPRQIGDDEPAICGYEAEALPMMHIHRPELIQSHTSAAAYASAPPARARWR